MIWNAFLPHSHLLSLKLRAILFIEYVIYGHQTNQLGEKLTHEKVSSSVIFKTTIYFLMFGN